METEVIADKLTTLIRPFIKSYRLNGDLPDFRRGFSGDELQNLLSELFNIAKQIRMDNER